MTYGSNRGTANMGCRLRIVAAGRAPRTGGCDPPTAARPAVPGRVPAAEPASADDPRNPRSVRSGRRPVRRHTPSPSPSSHPRFGPPPPADAPTAPPFLSPNRLTASDERGALEPQGAHEKATECPHRESLGSARLGPGQSGSVRVSPGRFGPARGGADQLRCRTRRGRSARRGGGSAASRRDG